MLSHKDMACLCGANMQWYYPVAVTPFSDDHSELRTNSDTGIRDGKAASLLQAQ